MAAFSCLILTSRNWTVSSLLVEGLLHMQYILHTSSNNPFVDNAHFKGKMEPIFIKLYMFLVAILQTKNLWWKKELFSFWYNKGNIDFSTGQRNNLWVIRVRITEASFAECVYFFFWWCFTFSFCTEEF